MDSKDSSFFNQRGNMDVEEAKLRKECLDKKFYSFGTAKIFEKRCNSLKKYRNIITYLGFLPFIIVGGIIASFSLEPDLLKTVILPIAGLMALIQALLSLWSVVEGWDSKYYSSMQSIVENVKLTSDFEELETEKPNSLKKRLKKLREKYNAQEQIDSTKHISKKEKRYGMREVLFHYKLKCPTCNIQPKTLKPGKCDNCGNF